MAMPWFTTKGQIGQLLFQIIAAILVAIKVWPDMVSNRFLSLGAWIFYVVAASLLYSLWRLIRRVLFLNPEQVPPLVGHRSDDVIRQMRPLTCFQLFALWQLLLRDGCTGIQFRNVVTDYGFPISNLADERAMENMYHEMTGTLTFLLHDSDGTWNIKTNFKEQVKYLIQQRSPLLGI
jgi:hypothetical protein